MGIVQTQRKQIDELIKKAAGAERKAEKMKAISNSRAERAKVAEAQLAAAELLIKILLKRLGGDVKIKEEEWQQDYGEVAARFSEEEKMREFKLI